ncbi:MAG: DUF835 domain-containing protein [Candidatus Thermoplasmatota archaeon]|nr:DUF835 domain-containing protein [Candidatus Thermoplasmatota archaeon]
MDEEEKIELYIKGYKQGLKDAWSDIESTVSKYEGWELKSRVESRIGTLYQDVESKREDLKEDPSPLTIEEVEGEKEREEGEEEGEREEKSALKDFPWKPGDAYLFIEEKPHDSLENTVDIVDKGVLALFVLRRSPKKDLGRFDASFEDCKFIMLSRQEGKSETFDGVEVKRNSPEDLPGLSDIIGRFLKSKEKPVVFLSGLSFLMDYNPEGKVLQLLHWVKDKVTNNEACLVTSLPANAVEEKFLEKVKGEFDRVY